MSGKGCVDFFDDLTNLTINLFLLGVIVKTNLDFKCFQQYSVTCFQTQTQQTFNVQYTVFGDIF